MWTHFDPNGEPDESWPPVGQLVLLHTPFGIELGEWHRDGEEDDAVLAEWYDEHNSYNDAVQDWGSHAHWAPIPEFDA